MTKSTVLLLLLGILAFPARLLGQTAVNVANIRSGSETVKPCKMDDSGQILRIAPAAQGAALLTTLPLEVMKHHPQLLGIFDFDGDAREEIFIGWMDPPGTNAWLHHFQIYRAGIQQIAIFIREFQIEGGPISSIIFPIAPKGRNINAAIAVVMIAAGIDFKDGSLKLSWVNDKIDITFDATVKDVDNDGEEEVIFTSQGNQTLPQGTEPKTPLLLKGVKDFLPYPPKK